MRALAPAAVALGLILPGCGTQKAQTERITVTIQDYDVGQDPELARQQALEADLEKKIAELDAKMIKLEELGDTFERMLPPEEAGEVYIPDADKLGEKGEGS